MNKDARDAMSWDIPTRLKAKAICTKNIRIMAVT
jgi:hypothetical protein